MRLFTIPKNKKEYEGLFGTKDESGRWIPPEDSYVDPKSGNILNREGVVIGTTNTKPIRMPWGDNSEKALLHI